MMFEPGQMVTQAQPHCSVKLRWVADVVTTYELSEILVSKQTTVIAYTAKSTDTVLPYNGSMIQYFIVV